jgi:hypothetical protein
MGIVEILQLMESEIETLKSASSDFTIMNEPQKAEECLKKANWTENWFNTLNSALEKTTNEPQALPMLGVINCPHCGSSDLDKNEHFCNNCSEYFD